MPESHHTKEKTSPQDEQSNGKWSILEKLAGKYNESERQRVDKMKDTIEVFGSSEYIDKKIDIPPTTARKIGRMAMDLLGIHFPGSEKRRDKEAASIALNELVDERAQKEEAERLAEEQQRLEQERIEEEKRRHEQEMLGIAMRQGREVYDMGKKQEFRNQRAQEILERDLNRRLLKVETLEDEAIAENPEAGKRTIPYEGKEIVVYDLKGMPFEILSHTVDYRWINNNPEHIGSQTAQQIVENPEEWTKRRDEAEKHYGFGTRSGEARGDVISCSYSNSDQNMSSRYGNIHEHISLVYGFDHVEPDSTLSVNISDAGTSNMGGTGKTKVSKPDEIKKLRYRSRVYNEVVLRRYSEVGAPKKPDYIIAEDGRISEAMLRHAKFFGIPIVNIDTKVYEEKQLEKGKEIIDSITMDDEYKEIDHKIAELESLDVYKPYYQDHESIGRNMDIIQSYSDATIRKECVKVEQIEMAKRIDFIEETMKKFIEQAKRAIENGAPIPTKPDGFEYVSFSLEDLQSGGTHYSQYGIERDSGWVAPGNCNWINFSFKLKDSPRSVTTSIYDGEHPLDPEEAIKRGTHTEKEFENADSSYYERIAPLIIEYCSLANKPRS